VEKLSINKIKWLRNLHSKKLRTLEGFFLVEGEKMIAELISNQADDIHCLVLTNKFIANIKEDHSIESFLASEREFERISTLKTPQGILAVVKQSAIKEKHFDLNKNILILDGIQDPGNLGTIIRSADWFGIDQIFCSSDTVEIYNPKVIQASMGSAFRVNVKYGSISEFIATTSLPVFGALLNGTSCYETTINTPGILIIGNEGKGISPNVAALISHPITIPKIGAAESLNAGVACGILLSIWQK
jgi:TrmH family RNA methyltransferase